MHTTPALGNLSVSRHPLIEHKLSIARDRTTTTKLFKELVEEIAMLMAYEATSDLPLEAVEVSTPLESMRGRRVSGKKLTLVPVLRAGLGMVEGVLRLVPSARVGHIGMYRDHDTLEPVDYYFKVPGDVAERHFFVLDPMLATGGSAVAAVSSLKRAGATRIRFLCIVAAPAGVERMERVHPDVPVYAAALDRELNAQGYIVPGLGDAAERDFFLLDPMLATGGSAVAAVSSLKRAGATRIRFLCLVAAPEGVRRLAQGHPDVTVYCAALDRALNEQGYIMPGLGDAGDRLFGTR